MPWALLNRSAVLGTGSRDWADEHAVRHRLSAYDPRTTTLIHGAQRGLDTIFGKLGTELGFTVLPVPYFSELGNRGGTARNELMLEILIAYRKFRFRTYVEAFPLPESVGTIRCIDSARLDRFDVHVWSVGWLEPLMQHR
jgi:hypothetical protein